MAAIVSVSSMRPAFYQNLSSAASMRSASLMPLV
jgi:hypothetical protein